MISGNYSAIARTSHAFVIAWLVLVLSAFSSLAQTPAEAPEPTGEIAIDADLTTDAAIAKRIKTILHELEGFETVIVSVNAGVVQLRGRVLDGAQFDRLQTLVNRVEGVVAIENEVTETTDVADRLAPALERLQGRLSQAFALAPLMLVAIVAFTAIVLIGFFLAARRQPFQRLAPNAFIADIYRQIVRVVSIVAGVVIALDLIGATALLGTVLGAAGIVGLAIGFAVRDTVENFIASILLSIRQPFRPNDFVSIEGQLGNVIRLTSRATILMSVDGNHVRIPNSTVFKSTIVNYSLNPERRFEFELGVDADADLAGALETSLKAICAAEFLVPDPPPAGWIENVGDSNVVLKFAAWIDQRETDFLRARGETIRLAKVALESAGFGLPEPIYRLRFDGTAPFIPENTEPLMTRAAKTPSVVVETAPPQSVEKDESIARKVDEERREVAAEDLLTEEAPQE